MGTLQSKKSTAKSLDSPPPASYNPSVPNRPTIPAAPIRDSHMPPDDHMVEVGVALITCLPLGLVALCHSRRVSRRWQANDREGARRASKAAWAWSFRAMLIPVLLFGLIMLYWGWIALREDFRPYAAHNVELYELLYGRHFADEDDGGDEDICEDEDSGEDEEDEE